MMNALNDVGNLFCVEVETNYMSDVRKFIFADLDLAKTFVHLLFSEACTSLDFDAMDDGCISVRSMAYIDLRDYCLDFSEANVSWEHEGISQHMYIRIKEVKNMLSATADSLKDAFITGFMNTACYAELEDANE